MAKGNATSRERGEELNQLSRLLFDTAARKWWAAFMIDALAALLGVVLAISALPADVALGGAIGGLLLVALAYGLKLWSQAQYGTAETMRRQAAFTEGLDWPIPPLAFDQWRSAAGKRILKRLKVKPRDPNYYSTLRTVGGHRLAEMTLESAFYTRHLYTHLAVWIYVTLSVSLLLSLATLLTTGFSFVDRSQDQRIVLGVSLLLPFILSSNVIGWSIQLRQQAASILNIEEELENMVHNDGIDVSQVLRLVAEYNCETQVSIPILNVMFNHWYEEIQLAWTVVSKGRDRVGKVGSSGK